MAILSTEYNVGDCRSTDLGEGTVTSVTCRQSQRFPNHPYLIELHWLNEEEGEEKKSSKTTLRLSRDETEHVVQQLRTMLYGPSAIS